MVSWNKQKLTSILLLVSKSAQKI